MKAGDIVLLCTDGLTDVIGDDQIAEGIAHQLTALELFDDLAAHLADRAVDAGTGDNVTVACYRHESGLHRQAPRPHDTLTMRYPDTLARALQSLVQERSR
jgi:protein phosphatase